MRRRLALVAVGAASVGAALALAADDQTTAGTPRWQTRPEVPGAARTLVPFGIETTAAGSSAWALGQSGDATVVLRRAPAGGWSSATLPVAGRPVGAAAPQHAGEVASDGHGAVLLADPAHPGLDATLVTRAPGAAFVAAPPPGAALHGTEQLVPNPTTSGARALLAQLGGADAATLIAPTTVEGIGNAVLRLAADGWHREDVDAPALPDPIHPVALAAAGPTRAWLLATSGGKVVLLHRELRTAGAAGADDAHWVPIALARDNLLGGQPLPPAVTAVDVAPPPADPLTATADGLWIDLRVTPAGATAPVDATEHLTVTDPPAGGDGSTTTPPSTTAPSTTTPPPPTPAQPAVALDGRWCDVAPAADGAPPLCDHRLGFAFAHGDRGYRSVATPATADAPFGTREVSAPVDLGVDPDAARHDAQRQGGYAQLVGDAFALRDGIGEDGTSTTQAIAFAADGIGYTGGTVAFGAVMPEVPQPPADPPLPGLGDAIAAAAAAPNGDGRVLALSRMGGPMLYAPGSGWSYANTALTSRSPHDRYAPPRALVWPRPDLLIAVGSAGLLVTARADPVAFNIAAPDGSFSPQRQASNFDALPVAATLLAVACTVTDPLECTAVGRDGLIVRGDGSAWTVEHLPAGAPDHVDVTSVAYDGRTPLLATTDGLYVGDRDGYARDDDLRDLMRAAGQPTAVARVATEPGGGTAVDGRFARDEPTANWRPAGAPLGLHPIALAAVRDNGVVRAIVSATPEETPLPEPAVEDEGDRNPPEGDRRPRHDPPPLTPSPVDAVMLRETADGWVDLDHANYQPSGGRDLPETTPNTRALVLDANGSGLLLGGLSGTETDASGRGPSAISATTSVRQLDHGAAARAPAPPAERDETLLQPGTLRLAVGGHPACLDRCAAGGGQGFTPDVHLTAAVSRIKAMTAAGAGPSALIFGGGRASLGGDPLDLAGARRYRELTQGAGVPTYVLAGPGDVVGGGDDAFASAFADAPAPEGSGASPDGIDVSTVPQLEDAEATRARRTFAFDVHGPAGAVRVVAIDNAGGRLAGGFDGGQATWLRNIMDQARSLSIPVVVVGSASLDGAQATRTADDAAEEIALLAGHASAYVATAGIDDPADPHFGGVLSQNVVTPPGAAAPLVLLQSSTLGYAPTQATMRFDGPYDPVEFNRQTVSALMLIDVALDRFDSLTGVAPVAVASEPILDGLTLDNALRSVPLGYAQPLGVFASNPAQQRFIWRTEDGTPQPASSPNMAYLPLGQCALWEAACSSAVPTDIAFASSNAQVARFVTARAGLDPKNQHMPQVVLDASGHVIDDPRGVFCPLALGTTNVTVTALGQKVTAPIEVVPVQLPRFSEGSNNQIKVTPIPPGTCGFPIFSVVKAEPKPAAPAPAKPAPTPTPAPAPKPAVHHPHHQPAPHHAPAPVPAPAPPAAAPPAPLAPVDQPAPDHARPPVAAAAKPPAPLAPPAPPQGLSAQPVQATQVSPFQAAQVQEQRRQEHAFESDSAAVAYAHPPSALPWELAGAAAALILAIAAGGVAGRARRRSVVPATSAVAARRR